MTFNISNFKGYISIWTDSKEAMKRLNPRLLNQKPANVKIWDNGKVSCGFKAGLISISGKDFYVKSTKDNWVMMPSTPKAKVVTNAPVATSQKIALAVTKSAGQVTLL